MGGDRCLEFCIWTASGVGHWCISEESPKFFRGDFFLQDDYMFGFLVAILFVSALSPIG